MAWQDESAEIFIGDRRVRVRRRRRSPVLGWITTVVAVLAAAGLTAWLLFGGHGTPAAQSAQPALTAPGGYRATTSAATITVALEVRNTTDAPLTVVDADFTAPIGLTRTAVALLAPGQDLVADAELPALAPVVLGTEPDQRNGFVAARFTVDCATLPTSGGTTGVAGVTGEQISVTVEAGGTRSAVSLPPPVIEGVSWLTATARHACSEPSPGSGAGEPLPPLVG